MKYSYEMTDDNNTLENFDDFDAIVPSPGVPSSHKIYATGKVISELDFLYPSVPSGFQIHAVTGTDGKSTTSWILYNFLKL
jgi:UDP-N-acetylmuramoylalanine-D-glutamate ligase